MTHELKNPLTALQGNIQVAHHLLSRLVNQAASLTDEQQHMLEEILAMLGRSQHPLRMQQRLINDLLDLSHLQQDQVELHLKACNLIGLVYETVQDHQAAHPVRLLTLDLPEQDPVLVNADRERVTQVLNNYLMNALKFSPASEPVEIRLTLEMQSARVSVTDHGPRLTREQQAQIWERFARVSEIPVQESWKEGLGLGLYICHQLVTRQQGQVGVESTKGQGATFWFTLPLLSAPSDRAEELRVNRASSQERENAD